MKVLCQQKKLADALRIVAHATPASGRTMLPILNNVRLSTIDEGHMQIAATNLETAIALVIEAVVQEAGALTVPAKLLIGYVNTLPSAPVTLATKEEEKTLTVSSGSQKSNMRAMNAEEFPAVFDAQHLPSNAEAPTLLVELPAGRLREMAERAVGAASKDGAEATTGVYCHRDGSGFHMVGLDSFRVAHSHAENAGGEERAGVVIPASALKSAYETLPNDEEQMARFLIGSNFAFFECGDLRVMMRLISATYPNYRALGKADIVTRVTFERAAMIDAIERAALFAEKLTNKQIRMCMTENGVQIVAEDADLGDCVCDVPQAVIDGPLMELQFNYRHLLYALKNAPDEMLTMGIHSPNKAVVIRTAEVTHIVMPLVIQRSAHQQQEVAETAPA